MKRSRRVSATPSFRPTCLLGKGKEDVILRVGEGRGRKQRRIPLSEDEATDVDEGDEGKRRWARRECELGDGVDAPEPMMDA